MAEFAIWNSPTTSSSASSRRFVNRPRVAPRFPPFPRRPRPRIQSASTAPPSINLSTTSVAAAITASTTMGAAGPIIHATTAISPAATTLPAWFAASFVPCCRG